MTVTQQDIKCTYIKKQNKLTWFDNTIALLTYTSWNTTRKYFLCKQIKKIKLENIQIPTFLIIYNSESLLVTSVHQVSNIQYIHVLKINNHSRSELYAHHDIVYALIQCIFKISDIPPFGVVRHHFAQKMLNYYITQQDKNNLAMQYMSTKNEKKTIFTYYMPFIHSRVYSFMHFIQWLV